jgi:small subunit ribosomal protein S9
MTEEKHYYQGTGRRKTAVARVRLYPGNGEFVVTVKQGRDKWVNKQAEEYFTPRELLQREIQRPLELTETLGSFNVLVRVRGGGISSQASAVRHALSRALLDANQDFRPILKKAGFLTRDARAKERKKVGLKRARKRPQYTKR